MCNSPVLGEGGSNIHRSSKRKVSLESMSIFSKPLS